MVLVKYFGNFVDNEFPTMVPMKKESDQDHTTKECLASRDMREDMVLFERMDFDLIASSLIGHDIHMDHPETALLNFATLLVGTFPNQNQYSQVGLHQCR